MPQVNVPTIPGSVSSVAAGVIPAKVDAYKPAEILQMMTSAQEYQKAKELLPYAIEQGKAQSQQQVLAADKANTELQLLRQNISRATFGALLNDPRLINGDPEGAVQALTEAQSDLTNLGIQPPDGGKTFNQMIDLAKTDPARLYQTIKNGVQQAGGAAAQYQTLQASQNAPIYSGEGAPQGVSQPTQPGVTPQQMARPYGSKDFGGEALPYPVRQPGIQFNPGPSEAADATAGFTYRTDLRTRADAVPLNQRNIAEVQDVVKKIQASGVPTAGKPGEFQRWINKSLGTPLGIEYQRLSKDLAQVQISQMSENQLKTDAGRDLQAAANGKDTLAPEVLQSIARRQAANFTALDLQSRGAEKFANTYQDRNLKTFQKQWQANADSKVFELISLKNSGLSKEELLQETKKLLGTNPKAIQEYALKAENIERLSNGLPPLKELKK